MLWSCLTKTWGRPEAVDQAYNPNYSGDRDQEDHGSKTPGQKNSWASISTNSWMWWYTSVTPTTQGSTNRRSKSSQKITKHKNDWGIGSSNRHLPSKHKVLSSNAISLPPSSHIIYTHKKNPEVVKDFKEKSFLYFWPPPTSTPYYLKQCFTFTILRFFQ
jgi:hypothetical protein